MIVVIDSNVWVSALLNCSGVPAEVVDTCLYGSVQVAITPRLLSELERVLTYDHVRKVLDARGVTEHARATIALLRATALVVEAVPPAEQWATDADDNWFVQCAITANAAHLISGDRHLLSLGQVGSIQIISPVDFLSVVRGAR